MKRGFTLIEMLVSIIIFSFIIALAAYSFRFYADITKKIIMPYPQRAVNFSNLGGTIRSMFYFVSEKSNELGKKSFYIYFYGDASSMSFITAKPIKISDNIAVCKLYLDNGTLILDESPVYSKYNNYKEPTLTTEDEKKVIIMKNVSDLQLTYFRNQKKIQILKEQMPQLVEIQLKQNGKQMTFYFKIKADFVKKINWTELFYAPF